MEEQHTALCKLTAGKAPSQGRKTVYKQGKMTFPKT